MTTFMNGPRSRPREVPRVGDGQPVTHRERERRPVVTFVVGRILSELTRDDRERVAGDTRLIREPAVITRHHLVGQELADGLDQLARGRSPVPSRVVRSL